MPPMLPPPPGLSLDLPRQPCLYPQLQSLLLQRLDIKALEDIIQFCDQESVQNLRLTCKPLHKLCDSFFVPFAAENGVYSFAYNRRGLSQLVRLTKHPEAWKRITEIRLGVYRLPYDLVDPSMTLPHRNPYQYCVGHVRLRMERLYNEDGSVYWQGPMAIRPSDPEYAFCLAKDDQLILDHYGEGRNMLYTALKNLRAQGATQIGFHIWADGLCRGRGSKQYDELRALGCELPDPRLQRNSDIWRDKEQIAWACHYSGLDMYWCHCPNSREVCQERDYEELTNDEVRW